MAKYIGKRLIYMVVTLFVVAALTFILMKILPGSPFDEERFLRLEEAKQAVVEMKGAVYEGVVVEVNGKRWVATERAVGVKVKDDESGLKIDHI